MPSNVYSVNDRRALSTADLPKQEILYGEDAPERTMLMPDGTLALVKVTETRHLQDLGWMPGYPVITASGTAIVGGVTEVQFAADGETLTLTLLGGTWAVSSDWVGLRGDGGGGSDGYGSEGSFGFVRTSPTLLTGTVSGASSYSIASNETVIIYVIPGAVLSPNGTPITVGGVIFDDPDTYIPGLNSTPSSFVITAS